MKHYRVTFTIDVNSADDDESYIEAEYQLKNKSYDMEQINMQTTELLEDDDDDSSEVESDLTDLFYENQIGYGGIE